MRKTIDININELFFMFFGRQIDIIKNMDFKEIIALCANKAYLDFCRTIEYNGKCQNSRNKFKKEIIDTLADCIDDLIASEDNFDYCHECICNNIIQISKQKGITLHIGQAQKWINMTLKYLRIIGVYFENTKEYMHIPIDNYIIEAASESTDNELFEGMEVTGLGISKPFDDAWSRCDKYCRYLKFQKAIREKTNKNQLAWEAKAWIAMAMRHAIEANK